MSIRANVFVVGSRPTSGVTAAAFAAEASARAAADTTLQTNITAEATARAAADTALQENLTAETASRASADTAIEDKLTRHLLWDFLGDGTPEFAPYTVTEDQTLVTSMLDNGHIVDGDGADAVRAMLWDYLGEGDASDAVSVATEDGYVLVGASASATAGVSSSVIDIVTDDGQSNAEGQAQTYAATVYGTDTSSNLLTLRRGTYADVWLGLTTTGGDSLELDGNSLTSIGSLVPQIASTGTHGSTSSEGMARAMLARDPARVTAIWSNAEGGQSMANLLPDAGTGYYGYANAVTAITRAAALAAENGQKVVWSWMIMQQMESDTSDADLAASHDLYRSDLTTVAQSITGQYDPIRMISFQMSSFKSSSDAARSVLDYALDNADAGLFFCGGPTYWAPFADDYLHNRSIGHARIGELAAAIRRSVEDTGEWVPLHMVSASVTGTNEITVALSEAAVTETNDTVTAIDNLGITLTGATVASVSLSGAQLVITTSDAASGASAVHAALTGHGDTRSAETIPRSNIRSQAGYGQILAGGTIRKWLCHQSLSLS